jgi:hypothetical protein
MAALPCFLCGNQLDQRTSKNGKPYFVCDQCGTQFFVRRKQGIEKLAYLFHTMREHNLALRHHGQRLFEISATLNELSEVGREFEKLNDSISIFSKGKREKQRALTILRKHMQKLLNDLEKLTR